MYRRQATAHLPVFPTVSISNWDTDGTERRVKIPIVICRLQRVSHSSQSHRNAFMPHHVFSLQTRFVTQKLLGYLFAGDIVLAYQMSRMCLFFSSNITFRHERLSDELEFKSHMLLLRLGGKKQNKTKKNFTTVTNSPGNFHYCYFWCEIVFHSTCTAMYDIYTDLNVYTFLFIYL